MFDRGLTNTADTLMISDKRLFTIFICNTIENFKMYQLKDRRAFASLACNRPWSTKYNDTKRLFVYTIIMDTKSTHQICFFLRLVE